MFTGTGRDNKVDLKSEAGTSRLKATLTDGRVTGGVELPGGKTVSFEATSSANGPAGIFHVGLDDQGNLTGASRGGKTMKLSPVQSGGEPAYRGTINRTRRRPRDPLRDVRRSWSWRPSGSGGAPYRCRNGVRPGARAPA